MSLVDQEKITAEVGWTRTDLCPSGASRVRRRRNYWTKPAACSMPDFHVRNELFGQQGRLVGPLEPEAAWALPGWTWGREDQTSLRFPIFTRAIPRSRPVLAAPGLHSADDLTLERYRRDQFRFPPYTYAPEFCVQGAPGSVEEARFPLGRVLQATEREALMGFRPGHTLPAVAKAFRTSEGWHARDRDTIRCAQVSNSFHTLPVAVLLGSLLHQVGFPDAYRRPSALQESLLVELLSAPVQVDKVLADATEEAGLIIEQNGTVIEEVAAELEAEEWAEFVGSLPRATDERFDPEQTWTDGGSLSSWLVEAHVRSVACGADVRLDLGPLSGHVYCIRSALTAGAGCGATSWLAK